MPPYTLQGTDALAEEGPALMSPQGLARRVGLGVLCSL